MSRLSGPWDKGRLTARGRRRMKAKNFVFPRGTKAAPGEPKFPINNRVRARNALSRAAQKRTKLTKTERCAVVRKVCDKFPNVGLCKTNTVPKTSVFAKCNGVAVATKKKAVSKRRVRRHQAPVKAGGSTYYPSHNFYID